jgi:peptidoglycan hydrolase CwlO-like protein
MGIKLSQSVTRIAKLVSAAVVGVALVGLGALAFQNYQTNLDLLETIQQKEQEISRLQQAAKSAGNDVILAQKKVKELSDQAEQLDAENAEQANRISVLEAQTAACEAIKSKGSSKK